MRFEKILSSLVATAALTACGSAPSTSPPTMDVPAAFKQGPVFVKLNPHAAEVPDAWWTLFNDPVLNDLQDRLIKGNQTLASAAAAVSSAAVALLLRARARWDDSGWQRATIQSAV